MRCAVRLSAGAGRALLACKGLARGAKLQISRRVTAQAAQTMTAAQVGGSIPFLWRAAVEGLTCCLTAAETLIKKLAMRRQAALARWRAPWPPPTLPPLARPSYRRRLHT